MGSAGKCVLYARFVHCRSLRLFAAGAQSRLEKRNFRSTLPTEKATKKFPWIA